MNICGLFCSASVSLYWGKTILFWGKHTLPLMRPVSQPGLNLLLKPVVGTGWMTAVYALARETSSETDMWPSTPVGVISFSLQLSVRITGKEKLSLFSGSAKPRPSNTHFATPCSQPEDESSLGVNQLGGREHTNYTVGHLDQAPAEARGEPLKLHELKLVELVSAPCNEKNPE